jgi:hypothetical protein
VHRGIRIFLRGKKKCKSSLQCSNQLTCLFISKCMWWPRPKKRRRKGTGWPDWTNFRSLVNY